MYMFLNEYDNFFINPRSKNEEIQKKNNFGDFLQKPKNEKVNKK
jgi:hypothetical protein